jgi:hypothetical protein
MARTYRFRKTKKSRSCDGAKYPLLEKKVQRSLRKKAGYNYLNKETKTARRYSNKKVRLHTRIALLKGNVEPLYRKTCGWLSH